MPIIFMLVKGIDRIKSKKFMQYWHGLTEGLSMKSRTSLMFYPLYFLRRITFCLISFYLTSTPTQQVQLVLFHHLFLSIY